jgi:hypothetical protein
MATIDKTLPNTLSEEELLNQGPIEQMLPEETPMASEDVEVVNTEDGGAEVSFDPNAVEPPAEIAHNSNLADYLDKSILTELGITLSENYEEYRESRKDWEDTYRNGLDLLGFKYVKRTEPFRGASGVTHPVLAEGGNSVSSSSV